MKIGFFTDPHYASQEITCGKRYNSKSLERIQQAYAFFENEKCDLVICLGDLIDKEVSHEKEIANLTEISQVIKKSPLKTVFLMGNHDAFAFTQREFYEILEHEFPTTIEADGKTLIFMDACYFKNGNHYMPGDSDWKDTFYPHVQDLESQLDAAPGDVYIFVHQNVDPNIREDHRLHNSEQIHSVLHNSKKVKAVYQGHYHPGSKNMYNGIRYVTFPALCENEKAFFVEEI